ncbi:hypothetical protein D3C73_551640 [compost metagenome]
MAASNIELFDEFTGKIFARLYENFPIPINLNSKDFFPPTIWEGGDASADGRSQQVKFFYATTEWLAAAGYTSSPDKRNSYARDVVLTAKGLEVLKGTPSSLNAGPSIGEQLVEAAKEEGKDTLKSLVKEALSLGVKLIGPTVGFP